MAISLSTLTDTVLWVLRESGFSNAYPQVLLELMCNASQQDICEWRCIHPITGEETQKWALHFLNKEVFYSNVAPTTLTSDLAIWSVEIESDTTDYPSTWHLYLWWQVVPYTGITSTSFTWVSGVLVALDSGTQVSICFAMPTDYSSIKNVVYNNRTQIAAKLYDDIFSDMKDYKGRSDYNDNTAQGYGIQPFYTIKDAAYFIPFQLNETGKQFKVRYEMKAPTMTASVDSIIDNEIYGQMAIAYLATAMVLFERWEEDRGSAVYNNGIKTVRKLYSSYNDTSFESQNWQAYDVGKWKLNI